MSDVRFEFASATIASLAQTATAAIEELGNIDSAFLMPACPMSTAGIGRTSGTLNNSFVGVLATASLTSREQVTFDDGESTIARNNLCGVWVWEYTGPAGGPHEFIRRATVTFTIPSGQTTADSAVIDGIVDEDDCLVTHFNRGNHNSSSFTSHHADTLLVQSGTGHVVRATRTLGSGDLTIVATVTEFTGSKWTGQRIIHTFASSSTAENETIATADPAHSFVWTSWRASGNQPVHNQAYAWLTSSTNLRFWCDTVTGSPVMVAYVFTNPDLDVTVYGSIDGTNEYAASGVSPETQTITAAQATAGRCVIGHMGSDLAAVTACMSGHWLIDINSGIRARRSNSAGGTEGIFQVLSADNMISARIDSVSTITDGSTVTVTGVFGNEPYTLTHGGEAITLTTSSPTTLTYTASIGNKLYGEPYPLVFTDADGATAQILAPVGVAATKSYTNLVAPILSSASRATSLMDDTDDLEAGNQLEASNVQGGTIADVTISSNGLIRVADTVTSFDLRANDGTQWYNSGTQYWEDIPAAISGPPAFSGTIADLLLQINVPIVPQDYTSHFSDDGTTLSYTASGLPTGMSFSVDGVLSGTPTVAGVYTTTYAATDEDDQTATSNAALITVLPASSPDEAPVFAGPNFGLIEVSLAQAYAIDVSNRFTHATDPLTYEIVGTLPDGFVLAGIYITGTPTELGTFRNIQVRARDVDGDTALSDVFSMRVYVPSAIEMVPLSDGIEMYPI